MSKGIERQLRECRDKIKRLERRVELSRICLLAIAYGREPVTPAEVADAPDRARRIAEDCLHTMDSQKPAPPIPDNLCKHGEGPLEHCFPCGRLHGGEIL